MTLFLHVQVRQEEIREYMEWVSDFIATKDPSELDTFIVQQHAALVQDLVVLSLKDPEKTAKFTARLDATNADRTESAESLLVSIIMPLLTIVIPRSGSFSGAKGYLVTEEDTNTAIDCLESLMTDKGKWDKLLAAAEREGGLTLAAAYELSGIQCTLYNLGLITLRGASMPLFNSKVTHCTEQDFERLLKLCQAHGTQIGNCCKVRNSLFSALCLILIFVCVLVDRQQV